jgi:hypothetical protein
MAKGTGILDKLDAERWQALEAVYAEKPRVVPWDGWQRACIMHLTAGLDDKTAQAATGNVASLLVALTHAARVGLLLGDDARLVSRGGAVRYHVTPDGRTRLGHAAGILIRSKEVFDCDTFEADMAAGTIRHIPSLAGRMNEDARIIGAWATGEWTDAAGVTRKALEVVDVVRLSTAEKHGDKAIWDQHPAKMARNTAITDLWRYLPRSADMDAVTQASREEPPEMVAPPQAKPLTYADAPQPEPAPEQPPADGGADA